MEIVEACIELMKEKGYTSLTVRDISQRAEVDKALIYHRYGGKKELIIEVLNHLQQEITRDLEEIQNSDRPVEKLLDYSLDFEQDRWRLEKSLMEVQAQASENPEISEKLKEIDSSTLEKLQQIFQNAEIERPKETSKLYLSALQGGLARKASTQDREGIEEVRSSLEDLLYSRKT